MADEPNLAPQEQPHASIVKQPGLKITTQTLRGAWETLKTAAEAARVGMALTSSADPGFNGLSGRISTVQCVRGAGGLADYTVSTTEREEVVIWNLDFMEIQKPIRTWHGDKEGEEKPDLKKLRAWERIGESEATQKEYDRYVWQVDGGNSSKPEEVLEGPTLTLAKMIREEGIESFAIYTPVLTKTSVVSDLTKLEGVGQDIGKIGAPDTSGGEAMGDLAIGDLISGLDKQWLKTADRLQGALDGTFQRTEVWTGADKWNPNLYASSTGSGSGGNGGDGGSGGGGLDIPDLPDTPDL